MWGKSFLCSVHIHTLTWMSTRGQVHSPSPTQIKAKFRGSETPHIKEKNRETQQEFIRGTLLRSLRNRYEVSFPASASLGLLLVCRFLLRGVSVNVKMIDTCNMVAVGIIIEVTVVPPRVWVWALLASPLQRLGPGTRTNSPLFSACDGSEG